MDSAINKRVKCCLTTLWIAFEPFHSSINWNQEAKLYRNGLLVILKRNLQESMPVFLPSKCFVSTVPCIRRLIIKEFRWRMQMENHWASRHSRNWKSNMKPTRNDMKSIYKLLMRQWRHVNKRRLFRGICWMIPSFKLLLGALESDRVLKWKVIWVHFVMYWIYSCWMRLMLVHLLYYYSTVWWKRGGSCSHARTRARLEKSSRKPPPLRFFQTKSRRLRRHNHKSKCILPTTQAIATIFYNESFDTSHFSTGALVVCLPFRKHQNDWLFRKNTNFSRIPIQHPTQCHEWHAIHWWCYWSIR